MKKTIEQLGLEARTFSKQVLDIAPSDENVAVGGSIIAAATIGIAAGRSPEELRTLLTVVIAGIAIKVLATEATAPKNQDSN